MEWNSFFEKQPEDGQDIWYYGPMIGVWSGKYNYSPNDPVSPHIMYCAESFGVVDRMDAPWWMADDSIMVRPQRPDQEYPADYPS